MGALTDRYCIVGVGETPHMRPSGRTTLSMACEAIKKALDDAGLKPEEVDGMTSYQAFDSASSTQVASALGMRLSYAVDIIGGGSSTEALVAHAMGLMEAGYCRSMVIFRSMNGRSGLRMGGQDPGGPAAIQPISAIDDMSIAWGFTTPAQHHGLTCMRYMRDYGLTSRQLGEVAVAHRRHANLNPKAWFYRRPLTMEDYLGGRWISKPFRLHDCCLETDVAAAIIVVPKEVANNLRQPPVFIMGGTARTQTPDAAWPWGRPKIHYIGGNYGRERLFGMSGVTHKDIDFVSSYDAFTFTTLILLEAFGFCGEGEAGDFVEGGTLQIDNRLPCNLSGGHLSEGYTHGIAMVIENVRQLRHRADDACPGWQEGKHSYDRSKGCRQLRKADIATCLAWSTETQSSAMIIRR
ncbi:MAG: thiolase [Dehalococcoidia bacterium]